MRKLFIRCLNEEMCEKFIWPHDEVKIIKVRYIEDPITRKKKILYDVKTTRGIVIKRVPIDYFEEMVSDKDPLYFRKNDVLKVVSSVNRLKLYAGDKIKIYDIEEHYDGSKIYNIGSNMWPIRKRKKIKFKTLQDLVSWRGVCSYDSILSVCRR